MAAEPQARSCRNPKLWYRRYLGALTLLTCCADSPHMSMENRLAWPAEPDDPASPETPIAYDARAFAIRQQLWERAQRLYKIGELNQAAQLLSLAAAIGARTQRRGEVLRG